jgi:hypothetical protein
MVAFVLGAIVCTEIGTDILQGRPAPGSCHGAVVLVVGKL